MRPASDVVHYQDENLFSGVPDVCRKLSLWDVDKWQNVTIIFVCVCGALLIGYAIFQKQKANSLKKQLSLERAFKDNLIKTANIMILGLNRIGEVVWVNTETERVTGYFQEELVGKNGINFYP